MKCKKVFWSSVIYDVHEDQSGNDPGSGVILLLSTLRHIKTVTPHLFEIVRRM